MPPKELHLGEILANMQPTDAATADPAAGWAASVDVHSWILLVEQDGRVSINLQTEQLRGAGVAKIIFGPPIEGGYGIFLTHPDQAWPTDNYATWSLPVAAFDAVLAILRDCDPPVQFHVFKRAGEQVRCSLGAETGVRVQS